MLLSIGLTLICLVGLLLVRNRLVYDIRVRAIRVIFSYNDWEEKQLLLKTPTYDEMIFDLTRWTFYQFYPELAERERAQEET